MLISGGIPVGGNLGLSPRTGFKTLEYVPERDGVEVETLNNEIPAVRFDPSQLNVQPLPGYNLKPGYDPFKVPLERDRFILHNPRSGVAGNPFGSDFVIPQQRQQSPGGPQLNPLQQTPTRIFPKDQPGREGAIPVQFRQALRGLGNIGNMAGLISGNISPTSFGFQNKTVY